MKKKTVSMILLTISGFLIVGGIYLKKKERNDLVSNKEILIAINNQDTEKLEKYIAQGMNVNLTNGNNESLLLIAVHNNDIESARLLIKAGADVNQVDNIKDTPYLYAGANGRLEILKEMVDTGRVNFDLKNRYGGNTLIPAAEKGHLETVKYLVTLPEIDVDYQNNFGYTALIEAVALTSGSEVFQDIVRVLLSAGANKDLKDNSGLTALDYAHQKNYSEMIKLLSD